MNSLKKLTGETAIYGVSSIVGRFMNWWLMPLYTNVFDKQSDYGTVVNVYAYVAFLMVLLTYGMETGFFRFASRENSKKVFSTSLISLFFTSSAFIIFVLVFAHPIALFVDVAHRPEFIKIMGITVAIDALSTIPFAKLRLEHKAKKFAVLRLINIALIILLNLFYFVLCPILTKSNPSALGFIYNPEFGIGYVFVSNLMATSIILLLLLPEMKAGFYFDTKLLKRMIRYSFPILIVGITGMINQNIDKILLPKLLPASANPLAQLGIYGASFKMAVLMNMFVQAFRYAFEPFFFGQKGDQNNNQMYSTIMKYFIIFGFIIFLGLSTFVDVLKTLIGEGYGNGIKVIPIILLANLFMGIFFNLSLWYKLTDKTRYGAYIGILGSIITLVINLLLIPVIGYYASAIGILSCFVVMCVVSYLLGQKHYPIKYDVSNFFFYLIVSLLLFVFYWMIRTDDSAYLWLAVLVNIVFLGIIFLKEKQDILFILRKKH